MTKENLNDNVLSEDTKESIRKFEEADEKFKKELTEFFERHEEEIAYLDRLRGDRNEALDSARQSIREDASTADITEVQQIRFDSFFVQKKWSSWFDVDSFVELAQNCGKYDDARAENVIQQITKVDGNKATEWLRKNKLTKRFEVAVDGKEVTPAIYGPKEIPPFGSEKK